MAEEKRVGGFVHSFWSILVAFLLVIVVAFAAGYHIGRNGIPGPSSDSDEVISAIGAKIEYCADLVSAKALYRDLYDYDNEGKIPYITQSSVTVFYSCTVYAGVDLTDVVPVVDEEEHTITVTIPEAQITAIETDDEAFRYFDSVSAITNPNNFESSNDVKVAVKKDAKKDVTEQGLLDEAEDHAKVILEGFLSPFEGEEYADKDGNCYEVIVEVEGEDSADTADADEE